MPVTCPNKSSQEWKDLVAKHKGNEDLAAADWNNREELKANPPGWFPMWYTNIEKLAAGEKRISVRPKDYIPGVYKFGDNYYQVDKLFDEAVNVSRIKNKEHLRKNFVQSDDIIHEHIQNFFEGKNEMFIYTIRKLEGTITNEVKESVINKEENVQEQRQIAPEEQYLYRRISRLTKEASEATGNKLANIQKELEYTKQKLEDVKKATTQEEKENIYAQFGAHALNLAEARLQQIQDGVVPTTSEDMDYIQGIIDIWSNIPDTAKQALLLEKQLDKVKQSWIINKVNSHYHTADGKPVSYESIKSQKKDISSFRYWTGSLIDSYNYLAHTIGAIVRSAQTKVERSNNAIQSRINNKVKEIESKSGRRIQSIFDEITEVEETESPNGTTFSRKKLKDAEDIAKASPEAQEFYKFYKEEMDKLKAKMPTLTRRNGSGDLELYALTDDFIPNVPKDLTFKEKLKKAQSSFLGIIGERALGDTTKNEDQKADIIDIDFIQNLDPTKKSDDLAHALFEFARSVHNYDEMSKALPEVRILQKEIEKTEYAQGSNPNFTKGGQDSNLYKATEAFIRAQVKGEYKLPQGRFGLKKTVNEKGEGTETYLDVTGTLDNLLSWNSLNKIGLAPINALANASFGKISNFIEAFGGRFVTRKDLRVAEKIFWQQTMKKDSVLNKLLEEYNVLQEMTDYELDKNLKTGPGKYLSGDKLKEFLYAPQKYGEKWIQASMMLGIMHKEGYINEDGELTKEWEKASEADKERLFNRITGVNNKLHGRYSPKESAAMQQHILFRIVSQFKKWVPAAIEARLDEKHYDPRIGEEVEGRYRTVGRVVLKELMAGNVNNAFFNMIMPVLNAKKALESGKLSPSEVYNMRKMFAETTIVLVTWLGIMALKGDDDDEERKKMAFYKSGMKLLNRVNGDVEFFFSPGQINQTLKNPAPLLGLTQQIIGLATGLPKALSDEKLKSNEKSYIEKVLKLAPGKNIGFDLYETFNEKKLPEF